MIGSFLFRYRAPIGIVGFILVFVFAHPSAHSLLFGLVPIVPGLALRIWAAGHMGNAGRVSAIEIKERIVTGPYRFLRHPLYVGNFLLVLGVLIILCPPWWLTPTILALFLTEYSLIARAETRKLGTTPYFSDTTRRFEWMRAQAEWITAAIVAAIYVLAFLRSK